MKNIRFEPFTEKFLSDYYRWAEKDHVKNTWFIDGYQPIDAILKTIEGNGYDFPFVILLDEVPIGYIIYCDLYAYKTIHPSPKGVFIGEPEGTCGVDFFIGEAELLNQGLGTQIMQSFCKMLFKNPQVKRIVIDPASNNTRAIRCYEKVGFKTLTKTHDGICEVTIMELKRY